MRAGWLIAIVAGLMLVLAPATWAAEPERADVVTHVFPETGHRVVAVALRYDELVYLRRGSPARAAFTVTADGVARTVLDVYSSPALPGDEWRLDARSGPVPDRRARPRRRRRGGQRQQRRRRDRAARPRRRLHRHPDHGLPR